MLFMIYAVTHRLDTYKTRLLASFYPSQKVEVHIIFLSENNLSSFSIN